MTSEIENYLEAIKEYEKGLRLLREKLNSKGDYSLDQTINIIDWNAKYWINRNKNGA
jgi:hypothetical protein